MKKIVFILVIILLCGCENKKCIKSHQEETTCPRTICVPAGKILVCSTSFYSCNKKVCDEYED